MTRLICIVVVLWGLIVQPLMAAMPVSMLDNDGLASHPVLDIDVERGATKHQGDMDIGDGSNAPCHGDTSTETPPRHCENCDVDCLNGVCASSCVTGSVAVLQLLTIKFDLFSCSFESAGAGARTHGLPSRIFHPPKHS